MKYWSGCDGGDDSSSGTHGRDDNGDGQKFSDENLMNMAFTTISAYLLSSSVIVTATKATEKETTSRDENMTRTMSPEVSTFFIPVLAGPPSWVRMCDESDVATLGQSARKQIEKESVQTN